MSEACWRRFSVRWWIEILEFGSGQNHENCHWGKVPLRFDTRRPGYLSVLLVSSGLAHNKPGWEPQYAKQNWKKLLSQPGNGIKTIPMGINKTL